MTNILYKKQNKIVGNDRAPISVKDEGEVFSVFVATFL